MVRFSRAAFNLKAGKTLNVYLADLPGTVQYPSPIRVRLQQHFDEIVKATSGFTSAQVQWSSQAPNNIQDWDLLVYFVRSSSESIVQKLWSGATLGDSGTTVVGTKTSASEVYLDGNQDNPRGLGNVAFHELMHNKCGLTNHLHDKPGLSLGRDEVTANTALSQGDIDLMSANLGKTRKQWTEGYAKY